MRGNLKTDEYFEEALRKTEERIEHLSETVEKACREHGKDFKGVKNGYAFLNTEYSKKFDILYTLGNHDEKLPEAFAGLLKYTVLSSDACIDVKYYHANNVRQKTKGQTWGLEWRLRSLWL